MTWDEFYKTYHDEFLIAVKVLLVLFITFIVSRIFRRLVKRLFTDHTQTAGPAVADLTRLKFILNGSQTLIWLVGLFISIYLIPGLHALAVSGLAGAGIFAAVLGFASQQAFSNIISGIFIVIFRPFRVNDRIQIGELHSGIVEDITLRHTVIRNFENRRIIIPNSIISNETLVNSDLTDARICRFVEFSISYDSDLDLAMQIMQEESEKHPNCIDARTQEEVEEGQPKVAVRLMKFGDSSVILRAYAWAVGPAEAFIMGTDLNITIKKRFDAAGIEIPYPYRTLVFKNPAEIKHLGTTPDEKL